MRAVLATVAVFVGVAAALLFGTVRAMDKGSPPAQYRIKIGADQPTNCTIRVTWPHTKEFSFSTSGEAVVDVPALPHGCSYVCLGIRLCDGSPYSRKIIQLVRGGQIVRHMSLREVDELPADASGTRRLSL
jgi:hypothetical protein